MRIRHLTAIGLAALAWACPAQTPPPAAQPDPAQALRDERRPAQPFTLVGPGLTVELGGSWEYGDERRLDFDLSAARARDRRVREHELTLEARARFGPDTQAFVQLKGLHETRRTQGSGRTVGRAAERGEMWWQRERLSGSAWSLQVGRVPLTDRRAWWWDVDLDAVRVRRSGSDWRLDTGLARELARRSSAERGVEAEQRGVWRWFGQATWPWAPRHALDAFWLVQHDASAAPRSGTVLAGEDPADSSDVDARWFGLRASGDWRPEQGPRLTYWADTAWLAGRERRTAFSDAPDGRRVAGATAARPLRGHAVDLGATLALPVPLRPSLTLGWARGSSGFRQTGLQENKSRLAGVKRWQRYGELVQPELANLSVASAGVGARVLANTSVEIVAHRYRQVRAAETLRGARLAADPQGSDRSIGREVDLLVAVRESPRVEFLFKASRFRPGAAYAPGRRDRARAVEFGIAINF